MISNSWNEHIIFAEMRFQLFIYLFIFRLTDWYILEFWKQVWYIMTHICFAYLGWCIYGREIGLLVGWCIFKFGKHELSVDYVKKEMFFCKYSFWVWFSQRYGLIEFLLSFLLFWNVFSIFIVSVAESTVWKCCLSRNLFFILI